MSVRLRLKHKKANYIKTPGSPLLSLLLRRRAQPLGRSGGRAGCAFAIASRAPAKPPSRRARTSHRRRRFARASMSTRTSGWEGRGRGSLRLVYVRSLALHAARCFAAEGEVNNTVLYYGRGERVPHDSFVCWHTRLRAEPSISSPIEQNTQAIRYSAAHRRHRSNSP